MANWKHPIDAVVAVIKKKKKSKMLDAPKGEPWWAPYERGWGSRLPTIRRMLRTQHF